MQAMKLLNFFVLVLSIVVSVMSSSCGKKSPEELEQINNRKAELAVRRAQVLTSENNIAEAIKILENAHRECGPKANICEALANAYADDGQFASAGMFFEQAFDSNNQRLDLLSFAAASYEQGQNYDAAVDVYKKYLTHKPKDVDTMKSLSKAYQNNGYFKDALQTLMEAINLQKRNPNTSEASDIGALWIKLDNIPVAKNWLEEALKATLPQDKEIRKEIGANLITVYLKQKDWNNLEKTIIMLDEIDPTFVNKIDPMLKAKLADFKHQLAEAEAIATADKMRKEAQEQTKLQEIEKQKELEQKQKELEQKQKAQQQSEITAQTETKKQDDNNTKKTESQTENKQEKTPELVDAQIKEQIVKNLPQEKIEPVVKKPEIEETDIQMYIRLATEAIKSKNKQKAIEYANKAYQENTKSTEAWSVMADAYELNGKLSDAYLAANEAYLVEEDDPKLASKVLYFSQKTQKPETFLDEALSLNERFPNNVELYFYLAEAYAVNKNVSKAKQYYQNVLDMDSSESAMVKKAQEYLKK